MSLCKALSYPIAAEATGIGHLVPEQVEDNSIVVMARISLDYRPTPEAMVGIGGTWHPDDQSLVALSPCGARWDGRPSLFGPRKLPPRRFGFALSEITDRGSCQGPKAADWP